MKSKKGIIALIVFLSILIVLIIGILVLALQGNFKMKKIFKGIGYSNKESEKIIYDKEFDSIFDLIDIDMVAGNIIIEKSSNDKIKVVIYSDEGKAYVNDEEVLDIDVQSKSCKFFCMKLKLDKVIVYLPEVYNKKININNNYGNTDIESFSQADMSINSEFGNVFIEEGNKVSVHSSLGNVEVKKSKELDIEEDCGKISVGVTSIANIKNSLGDIKIDTIKEGKVSIINNCGDIDIKELEIVKDSSIKSDLGDIEIGSTNEVYIDAKTSLGKVKINNNFNKSDTTLTINNSCGDIKVSN